MAKSQHIYQTKVQETEWNGKVTYRCYYLQANGRWARFTKTEYSTFAAAEYQLRELEKQSPDFKYIGEN